MYISLLCLDYFNLYDSSWAKHLTAFLNHIAMFSLSPLMMTSLPWLHHKQSQETLQRLVPIFSLTAIQDFIKTWCPCSFPPWRNIVRDHPIRANSDWSKKIAWWWKPKWRTPQQMDGLLFWVTQCRLWTQISTMIGESMKPWSVILTVRVLVLLKEK